MQTGEPLGGTLNSIHNLAFYLTTMANLRTELETSQVAAPELG